MDCYWKAGKTNFEGEGYKCSFRTGSLSSKLVFLLPQYRLPEGEHDL